MIKNLFIFLFVVALLWNFLIPKPKPHWEGQLVSEDPIQTSKDLPPSWTRKGFTFTPRAKYHIRAVVLSKHHYWAADEEDKISPYDFALGWGPMSIAKVINALDISQDGRWYHYSWQNDPPIDVNEIITHSANNHIIPDNPHVLKEVEAVKRFEIVDLDGYLVDVSRPDGWSWHTSLSRGDSGGGSCEVIWVKDIDHYPTTLN